MNLIHNGLLLNKSYFVTNIYIQFVIDNARCIMTMMFFSELVKKTDNRRPVPLAFGRFQVF